MFEGQEGVFPVAVSPCPGRAALHWDVPRCTGHAASLVFVDNSQEAPLGVVSADKSKEGAGGLVTVRARIPAGRVPLGVAPG